MTFGLLNICLRNGLVMTALDARNLVVEKQIDAGRRDPIMTRIVEAATRGYIPARLDCGHLESDWLLALGYGIRYDLGVTWTHND